MNERGSRKIPVTERQFLWVQDDDKGEVILHVGPTMVSPTAADRVVVDDGQGGLKEDLSGQPQRMIELRESQYAVLYNPLSEKEEGPNGKFKQGRNESKALRNGTRHMIPGPCHFFVRPGQRVEVRDAHHLASNQYLVVQVYGDVDQSAPYFHVTAQSATITTATAEDASREAGDTASTPRAGPVDLTRGKLIVIRGLDTQFYIPPTGVDVVPDLSADEKGLVAEAARKLLRAMPIGPSAAPEPQALASAVTEVVQAQMNEPAMDLAKAESAKRPGRPLVEQSARLRQAVTRGAPASLPASPEAKAEAAGRILEEQVQTLLTSDVYRETLDREVRKARLVRQAVVLGEKEFCVILDADGKRQIKVGPARVFPGPYDSFMTQGSDHRIYKAYELLPQRALWLRFISPITREKLAQKLPRGVELEKDGYFPGDELVLTGVNSFFFPFNEIEILHPLTGQPHVGNDHADVFIEAIGIDQKSGIYVRDLTTGEVRLVRGKQSYLVDPRKEVHITRTIPLDSWNLWIVVSEPHKQSDVPITTPWAVSIIVPHNTAILATSAVGQRVIQGPCVELLEYEENLVPMTLSTGTPKTDNRTIRTCFLRTVGNRVSDQIRIETADFVQIDVTVSYQVNFAASHKDKWFNHENYVGVMCDHLRSLVRGRCRPLRLTEMWPNIPILIRDIILGEHTDEGRKGRLFSENGMHVTEVEVLASTILDKDIAGFLEKVQRESVGLLISDRQASEQLRSEKLRHEIERERLEMKREARERLAHIEELTRGFEQAARIGRLRDDEITAREAADLEASRLAAIHDAQVLRDQKAALASAGRLDVETGARVKADHLLHEEEQTHSRVMAAIEIERIAAVSQALVAERSAIQPALVEALTAAGDKVLLGAAAENMNLVSLFRGKDVVALLTEVLGGTAVGRTLGRLGTATEEGNAGT